MEVRQTPIAGLTLVGTTPFRDKRGLFARLYCEQDMAEAIGDRRIVQINHSRMTAPGTIRGMHYQRTPHAEMKMVRCLRGRVWDVSIDIRRDSPTFLQWYAQELTPDNALMLAIPEGCAHGFQALEPDSEIIYYTTAFYAPEFEGGIRHDDPVVGIDWPLPVRDMSEKDRRHPLLSTDFSGLEIA